MAVIALDTLATGDQFSFGGVTYNVTEFDAPSATAAITELEANAERGTQVVRIAGRVPGDDGASRSADVYNKNLGDDNTQPPGAGQWDPTTGTYH